MSRVDCTAMASRTTSTNARGKVKERSSVKTDSLGGVESCRNGFAASRSPREADSGSAMIRRSDRVGPDFGDRVPVQRACKTTGWTMALWIER